MADINQQIDLEDTISANLKHLRAMLIMMSGMGGHTFRCMADHLQDEYAWACGDKARAIIADFDELSSVLSLERRDQSSPTPAERPEVVVSHALQESWSLRAITLGAEALMRQHQDSPSVGAVVLLFVEANKWLVALTRLLDAEVVRDPVSELQESTQALHQFITTAGHIVAAIAADPVYGQRGTRGENLPMVVNLLVTAQKQAREMKGPLAEARDARDRAQVGRH